MKNRSKEPRIPHFLFFEGVVFRFQGGHFSLVEKAINGERACGLHSSSKWVSNLASCHFSLENEVTISGMSGKFGRSYRADFK